MVENLLDKACVTMQNSIDGKFLLLNTLFKQVHTNNVNKDCIWWSFLYLLNQSNILQYSTYYGRYLPKTIVSRFNFLKQFLFMIISEVQLKYLAIDWKRRGKLSRNVQAKTFMYFKTFAYTFI